MASGSGNGETVYKLLMVGRSAVGKTCILRQYCLGFFSEAVVPTLGCDFVLKSLPGAGPNNSDVKLQVWDIAGQDHAPTVSHVFFRGSFGALIACDITSPQSYEVAAQWKRDIDAKVFFPQTSKNIPCVLLLNKSDIGQSHMSAEELDAFCAQNGFIAGWYQVSARTGENLDEAFRALLAKVMEMDAARKSGPSADDRKREAAAAPANQPKPIKPGTDAKPKDGKAKKDCPC